MLPPKSFNIREHLTDPKIVLTEDTKYRILETFIWLKQTTWIPKKFINIILSIGNKFLVAVSCSRANYEYEIEYVDMLNLLFYSSNIKEIIYN